MYLHIRRRYNALRSKFDVGGLACLPEVCCYCMILGRILLTPPLPGWTPVVGNVVLHAPYTHDLAPVTV